MATTSKAASKDAPAVAVAQGAFVADLDGESYDVREGDLFEPDHPLVAKYPALFAPPVFRYPKKKAS